jgi:hypothetical protein
MISKLESGLTWPKIRIHSLRGPCLLTGNTSTAPLQGMIPRPCARIADHSTETIVRLKNFRNASDPDEGIDIGIAPDGSALLTRDVGTQEVYSLTVKWP